MHRDRADGGFASVPLLAVVVPALLVTFLGCVEVGNVTYGWMRAQVAARAAATAGGADASRAALASLSSRLRRGADVRLTRDRVSVTVRPPSVLLPGSAVAVTATADVAPLPAPSTPEPTP